MSYSMVVSSQTILLEEDVYQDTLESSFGPNRKHYVHSFTNIGVIIGPSSEQLKEFQSNEFITGVRYKYKLSKYYSLGVNFMYSNNTFRKIPPISTNPNYEIDRAKYNFNSFQLELFNRFNFGKRGNIIGKFVDLGFYGSFIYNSKYYERKLILNNNTSISKYEETTFKNLQNVSAFNYGISIRAGSEWFSIYSKYRFSNIFENKSGIYLPKLTIGAEFAIVN